MKFQQPLSTTVAGICLATFLFPAIASSAMAADLSPLAASQMLQLQLPVAANTNSNPDLRGDGGLPFATPIPVDIDPESHGEWNLSASKPGDGNDNEIVNWQLHLRSENAVGLNFGFDDVFLPEGAQLTISSLQDGSVLGPFTANDNKPHGQLWTADLAGDEALLSVTMPAEQASELRLHLAQIGHGMMRAEQAQQRSGSCNNDVVCPTGNNWRDQIRATALISIEGRSLCSATLVNNTAQNGRPFLLTAEHCGIREGAVLGAGGNAATVVVYWNYQANSCGGARDSRTQQVQSGSTFRASNSSSDFTLVELDQAPPSSYNVYFAGWNAAGDTPRRGASIHHPSGDDKAISLFSSPARAQNQRAVDSTSFVDVWTVKWSDGITESGSSGSGLFDQNGQLVGQLSFGSSSCDNPRGDDSYGRFAVAWNNGGSANNQLRDWLDPANSGQLRLAGRNADGSTTTPSTPPDSTDNPAPTPRPDPTDSGDGGNGADNGSDSGNGGGTSSPESSGGNSGGGGGAFSTLLLVLLIAGRSSRQQINGDSSPHSAK